MTLRFKNKEINLREKLNELDVKKGTAGLKVLAGETYEDVQKAVGISGTRRNLIVNGSFEIWQRGTSFTAISDDYTADRWASWVGLPVNVSKHSDGGLLFSSTTDAEERMLEYRFEGRDSDNMIGKWLTISVDMGEATAGGRLHYFVYARNTAGSWQWNTTPQVLKNNTRNVQTFFIPDDLDLDKVRIRLTTSPEFDDDTWHIKHVQMEYGKVATPPEYPDYADELARCQRFYYRINYDGGGDSIVSGVSEVAQGGYYNGVTELLTNVFIPVSMRAPDSASIAYSSLSHFDIEPYDVQPSGISIISTSTANVIRLLVTDPSSRTVGFTGALLLDQPTGWFAVDNEMSTTDR